METKMKRRMEQLKAGKPQKKIENCLDRRDPMAMRFIVLLAMWFMFSAQNWIHHIFFVFFLLTLVPLLECLWKIWCGPTYTTHFDKEFWFIAFDEKKKTKHLLDFYQYDFREKF